MVPAPRVVNKIKVTSLSPSTTAIMVRNHFIFHKDLLLQITQVMVSMFFFGDDSNIRVSAEFFKPL